MEEFKGTPGPWISSTTDRSVGPVCKEDDQCYGMILPVAWVEFDGKPGHHQANANLIASAPELMEALQVAIDVIKAGPDVNYLRRYGAVKKAKAAIAKALGK